MRAVVLLLLLAFGGGETASADALSNSTVVVFNSSVPESGELARFYAQKRGIPKEKLVGIACSRDEEITRQDFDREIAGPLRKTFEQKKWWMLREASDGRPAVSVSTIRILVLIKGVPLKIKAAENYPGDQPGTGPVGTRNEASVDSELAALGAFREGISGAATNPYFQSYRQITDFPDPSLLLVCRLDAPTAATVKQMINDAVETEKNGLWGRAFVDGAHNVGNGLEMGDKWLATAVDQFRKAGVPVVYDDENAIFPDGYPISDCAMYFGWYIGDVAGPFAQPDFRFVPGAIAAHIHSFSANSLRSPAANWVAPLLTKGAAASVGNVYEPYLQLTTHLDIMNDRLLHGFSFAESSYMATQAISWMTVMVGDPLYRPYAAWLQIETKSDATKPNEWKMYHDFAVRNSNLPVVEYRVKGRQAASAAKNGPMLEDLGGMEMRDSNFAGATAYFQQARSLYTKRDDILRSVIEEADAWKKQNQPKRAADVVRPVLKIISDGPTAALLRKIEQDAAPK